MINLVNIYQYLRSTDGVNQFQRSSAALDPALTGIDERKKLDYINFIRNLSTEVNFFKNDNTKEGDWLPFFELLDTGNKITVKAASTVALPTVTYSNAANGVNATLTATVNGSLPLQDGIQMNDDDLLLVWQQVPGLQNGVYVVKQGNAATPFILTRYLRSDQKAELMQQVIEVEQGLVNGKTVFIQKTADPAVGVSNLNFFRSGPVHEDWSIKAGNSVFVRASTTAPLPPVKYINGTSGINATLTAMSNGLLPPQDGIQFTDGDLLLVCQQESALQNGVYVVKQGSGSSKFVLTRSVDSDQTSELIQQVVEVMEGNDNGRSLYIQKTTNAIVGVSDLTYFKTGQSRDDWPPHLALLLSFLQVNAIVQRDVNQLTARHMRHYYEKVLRLKRRPAIADQVHVVFELAKNSLPILLPAGTLLDAGKIQDGNLRRYGLDSEIVLNQATVESLKSSYTDVNSSGKFILFKAEDAKQVKSTSSSEGWRPFGEAQLNVPAGSRTMTEAQIGFAFATPALLLGEGDRFITITLDLQNAGSPIVGKQPFSHVFDITFTGDKEWITPAVFTADLETSKLTFTFTFPASAPPIAPYNEAIHLAGYETTWPVCRCIVKLNAFELERLANFSVSEVTIFMDARGLKNLVLQNDDSVQPVGKPTMPFGPVPVIKNNFYIGSKEIFSKSIESLKLHLEWQDLPDDISDYYDEYDSPNLTIDTFTAHLQLLAGKRWDALLLEKHPLFTNLSPDKVRTMEAGGAAFSSYISAAGYVRKPEMTTLSSFTNDSEQGFIRLMLTGPSRTDLLNQPDYAPFEAFGHKAFPLVFTKKAIELSQGGTVTLPNPPYVPTLKSVAVDYTATETFNPSNPNGIDQFFILDVFGHSEIRKSDPAKMVPEIPAHGALYIGLKNASAPQSISFLFQVETGTVPGAELLDRTDMTWSYLAGNQWEPITSQDILEDATDAMQKPGLIRLNIGTNATSGGDLMPAGYHWLRLAAARHADGAGALKNIQTQAARATLTTENPAPEEQLIAAKTISRLVNKVAAIKSVKQDYPSFNGLSIESDSNFFRRINERLRHRKRGVAGWDYERIVLEGFPDVFKVKCLPHTDADNNIAPGNVKLVVVPDMRFRRGGDILQPKENLASLRQIETYLKEKYLDDFVKVRVVNPAYETLLVDCKVTFLPGFDPGFYTNQLQEDVRRFLSPWAYEEGQDIIFGGKIFKSEILAFVEGRPYVDFVINFQVYHRFDGDGLPGGIGCMTIGDDFIVGTQPIATIGSVSSSIQGAQIGVDFIVGEPVEVAIATRADAILVSNAEHRVEALQAGGYVCSGVSNLGIGQMIIGLDFIPIS
jgi:hypothetical protein